MPCGNHHGYGSSRLIFVRKKNVILSGVSTHLKHMKVNWDDDIPNSDGKIKVMFQSSPTSFNCWLWIIQVFLVPTLVLWFWLKLCCYLHVFSSTFSASEKKHPDYRHEVPIPSYHPVLVSFSPLIYNLHRIHNPQLKGWSETWSEERTIDLLLPHVLLSTLLH